MTTQAVSIRTKNMLQIQAPVPTSSKSMQPTRKPTAKNNLRSPQRAQSAHGKRQNKKSQELNDKQDTDKLKVVDKKKTQPKSLPPKKPSSSVPSTPQQRRTVLPVKVRRAERRRDIELTTDALQNSQVDLELSVSPPSSSTSSTESDDSDATAKKAVQSKRQKNKRNTQSQLSQKQQVPAASAFPPLQQKKRHDTGRTRRRSSSAIDLRSQVYAGPTFNNAPAPSALPIPAFHAGATSSTLLPVEPFPYMRQRTVSLNLHLEQQPQQQPPRHDYHEDIFVIEDYHPSHEPSLQQQSTELMNLLTPARHYRRQQVPTKLVTSHDLDTDKTLSEIQRGLRSMLKIEAAS
ncbi:hypothetical protein DFQ28_001825 [Apophysomyces sp. BC1034]|nr:hypothetical protein DFQ30_009568 [Apophysomyces sp. BC1015]KAG0183288.1 hypothetical protein DFQ29_007834 [Apophysomyces sp. BC1021]KAG0194024.1 hypothetical protein DFQ28_001825 [Apophysomyces sp. BC1034]